MGNEEKRVLREAVREVERGMNKWKLVAEKYAELVKKEEEEGGRGEKKESGDGEGKLGLMVKTLSVTQAKKWWADIEKEEGGKVEL